MKIKMKQVCGTAVKKPVTIKWFFWRGHSISHMEELKAWIEANGEDPKEIIENTSQGIKIKTLEGTSYEVPRNYIIIRGIKGEYYPCDLVIFRKTYEVDEMKLIS